MRLLGILSGVDVVEEKIVHTWLAKESFIKFTGHRIIEFSTHPAGESFLNLSLSCDWFCCCC